MEPSMLLLYFFKINAIIAVLYLVFHFLYRKDHSYRFKRFFFLFIILIAFVIPNIKVDYAWYLEKQMDLIALTQGNTSAKVEITGVEIIETAGPKVGVAGVEAEQSLLDSLYTFYDDYLSIPFLLMYTLIVLVLALRLLVQLLSLLVLVIPLKGEQYRGYKMKIANKELAPFSFFNLIVLNPKAYTKQELALIVEHELIHVKQLHNFDILISELLCIICWFNPFAWRLKESIRQNLEFLADEGVLKSGIDPKIYQYCLLALQIPSFKHPVVANHFNKSLLKSRIMMMNSAPGNKKFSFKYLLLLPLFLVIVLTGIRLDAQQRTAQVEASNDYDPALSGAPLLEGEDLYVIIGAEMTMELLHTVKKEFAKRKLEFRFTNIDFTKQGELAAIKISVEDISGKKQSFSLNGKGSAIKDKLTLAVQNSSPDGPAELDFFKGMPGADQKITDKVLKKLIGIAIVNDTGEVWLKGKFDLGTGTEAYFGVESKIKEQELRSTLNQ